jgi:hypothetical protein
MITRTLGRALFATLLTVSTFCQATTTELFLKRDCKL